MARTMLMIDRGVCTDTHKRRTSSKFKKECRRRIRRQNAADMKAANYDSTTNSRPAAHEYYI